MLVEVVEDRIFGDNWELKLDHLYGRAMGRQVLLSPSQASPFQYDTLNGSPKRP